jgi:hypothetical protein
MSEKNDSNYEINDKPSWSAVEECWKHRWLYAIACAISILIAIFVSLCTPKVYAAQVKVVDEQKEMDLLIGLDNLTSLIKQQMTAQKGMDDAEVYSIHLKSRSFAQEMAQVKVKGYEMTYFDYAKKYHKVPWWTNAANAISNLFTNKDEKNAIIDIVQDNIKYKYDGKTSVLTIQFTDNNPVVAALMVDSVTAHLQAFLTRSKINKYHSDLLNSMKIRKETGDKYHEAQANYAAFCDSHFDILLKSDSMKQEALQKECDDAFAVYSNACEQYVRAQSYMKRRTAAFSQLRNATVPLTNIEPRLFAYIIVYAFITFMFITWWILFKRSYIEGNKE